MSYMNNIEEGSCESLSWSWMIFHVFVIWDVLTYFWLYFCLINDFFSEIFWFALDVCAAVNWEKFLFDIFTAVSYMHHNDDCTQLSAIEFLFRLAKIHISVYCVQTFMTCYGDVPSTGSDCIYIGKYQN